LPRLSELDEWKQAASVEAGLRREFKDRADKLEAALHALLGSAAMTSKMKNKIIELVVKGWKIPYIAAKLKIDLRLIRKAFPGGRRAILKAAARKKR